MKIIELKENNLNLLPKACGSLLPERERLLSWEAKKEWVKEALKKGYKMKLALGENKQVLGFIEYLPINYCLQRVSGDNLTFIDCIWVLNPYQKQGIGSSLLKSCLTHAMYEGYYGAAVWATDHLIMNKDFFKKFDFKVVDEESFGLNLYLLARSFSNEFSPPKFLKSKFNPILEQDVYNVELFFNPWCPYSYGVAKRAESLLNSCGEKINIKSHQLTQREDINKYNLSAGIFINGCDCSLDFLIGKDVLEILSQIKENEYAG